MASSSLPSFWGCPPSTTTTTTTTTHRFSLSLSSPSILNGSIRLQRTHGDLQTRTHVKFEKFETDETAISSSPLLDDNDDTQLEQSLESSQQVVEEEDDSCLPNDLKGAVRQSSVASATFVSSGGLRAIVELLIPQLQFLDDEGAQAELWELSRIFLDTLIEETGCERVKAIYPDAGAAALLKYRWKDAAFGFSSLSDRKPVDSEDEIVVMVVPDYQMLEYVERISKYLSDDPPRPLIMWNPRLISEDVGVGFNVRNLRRYFLSFLQNFHYGILNEAVSIRCCF
ncbi:hypothetical protein AQUCO_01400457v1 [Aquilegia coerulea]|uniref:DUF1995 domain-containing protein n=1 Tax=Aquilegia coerulea TaxID=218851 RepID=A0A2G5DWH7_AQUCA|nr:hypothetical protein AQUCO_01400457v1 [Aquilegia coerulea]